MQRTAKRFRSVAFSGGVGFPSSSWLLLWFALRPAASCPFRNRIVEASGRITSARQEEDMYMAATITIEGKIPGKSRPLFDDWLLSFPPQLEDSGGRMTLRALL